MGAVPSTTNEVISDDQLLKHLDNQATLGGSALTPQNNKFLRSLRCKRGGETDLSLVKIFFVKNLDLSLIRDKLKVQKLSLSQENAPNVLAYQRFREGGNGGHPFVSRQYFFANLKDRLSTRPFLSDGEKLWIAFCLLSAGAQLHNVGLGHGDIKSENVMLTSWGWIVLTDLAPFKPTFLEADQSAGPFNFFFSNGNKKRCYLAPERFVSSSSNERKSSNTSSTTAAAAAQQQQQQKETNKRKFTEALNSKEVDFKKSVGLLYEAAGLERSTRDEKEAQLIHSITKGTPNGGLPADHISNWKKENEDLLPSMDVFSIGCVLAELFNNDAESTFELSDALSYASKGESIRLNSLLAKITNPQIRLMVESMTKHDAANRLRLIDYLQNYNVFPKSFSEFLFPFMRSFLEESKNSNISMEDALVWKTCEKYEQVVENLLGFRDYQGEEFFSKFYRSKLERDTTISKETKSSSSTIVSTSSSILDPDDLSFENVENLIAKLEGELKSFDRSITNTKPLELQEDDQRNNNKKREEYASVVAASGEQEEEKVLLITIIINYLCTCVQLATRPSSRVLALLLLKQLCIISKNDELTVSRVIPFVVDRLSNDTSAWVRCITLQTLTSLLESVHVVPISEAKLFPDFLIPSLNECSRDSSEAVRVTFASCLPTIATSAKRFLEISRELQFLQNTQKLSSQQQQSPPPPAATALYDAELNSLHDSMQKLIDRTVAPTDSITGADFAVKNALVKQIMKLCLFFGRDRIDRWLLPWLLSVVNTRGAGNWRLPVAVVKSFASIGAFVGAEAYDLYLHPMIDDMLSIIGQDLVVEAAANCFTSLICLGLVPKPKMSKLVEKVAPLTRHPSIRVRIATVHLLAAIAMQLPHVDVQLIVAEKLKSFLGNNNNSEKLILLLGKTNWDLKQNAILLENCLTLDPYPTIEKWGEVYSRKTSRGGGGGGSQNAIVTKRIDFKGVVRAHTFSPKEKLVFGKVEGFDLKSIENKYGIETEENINGKTLLRRVQALGLPEMKINIGRLKGINSSSIVMTSHDSNNEWKPRGVLVTSLHEHSGPVNRIAVSEDGSFFTSGSDDGTAKVWLTAKLDRNPCPRSKVTFEVQGCVVDVCCIKNSTSFAVASDLGRVSVVRVDPTKHSHKNMKIDTTRVVALSSPANNDLFALTEQGKIYNWDLRSGQKAGEMCLVLGFGSVSCMAASTDRTWIAIGTHRGVIAIFDLRFNMLISAWRHPCSCAIHRLHCSKSLEGSPFIFVAAGPNQVVLLNLETGDTRYAFASALSELPSNDKSKQMEWKSSQESLFSKKYEPVMLSARNIDRYVQEAKFLSSSHHPSAFSSPHHSIRAILCPCDYVGLGMEFRSGELPPNVITAGTDMIVRYWDCVNSGNSSFISAPLDEPKCKWETKQFSNKGQMFLSLRSSQPTTSSSSSSVAAAAAAATIKSRGKFAVSPSHTDAILDLAGTKIDSSLPYQSNVLISAGRDSVIRIWQ